MKGRLSIELGVVVIVIAEIAAFICLGLVRYGDLPRVPWGIVALAVGIVGGVAAFMMAVVESARSYQTPSNHGHGHA